MLKVTLQSIFMPDAVIELLSHILQSINFLNTSLAFTKIKTSNWLCETCTRTSEWESLSHLWPFTQNLPRLSVCFCTMNTLWWMTWRTDWSVIFRTLWLCVKLNLKIWPLLRHIYSELIRLNTHCTFSNRMIRRNLLSTSVGSRTLQTPLEALHLHVWLWLLYWQYWSPD